MDIWKHQPILTFVIKRFARTSPEKKSVETLSCSGYRVGLKNEKPVQYPLQGLDIAPYISVSNGDAQGQCVYDLFGVIVCHTTMLQLNFLIVW